MSFVLIIRSSCYFTFCAFYFPGICDRSRRLRSVIYAIRKWIRIFAHQDHRNVHFYGTEDSFETGLNFLCCLTGTLFFISCSGILRYYCRYGRKHLLISKYLSVARKQNNILNTILVIQRNLLCTFSRLSIKILKSFKTVFVQHKKNVCLSTIFCFLMSF